MDIIPVTLLTGFLGSGKSTLLTQLLQDPKFCDTAVVVNEFGEVGLDENKQSKDKSYGTDKDLECSWW